MTTEIQDNIIQLEKNRKKKYPLYRAAHGLYVLPIISILYSSQFPPHQPFWIVFFLLLAPILLSVVLHYLVISPIARSYSCKFKATIVKTIVKEYYPNVHYDTDKLPIKIDLFMFVLQLKYHQDFSVEDVFKFEQDDYSFNFLEFNSSPLQRFRRAKSVLFNFKFPKKSLPNFSIFAKKLPPNLLYLAKKQDDELKNINLARINRYLHNNCLIRADDESTIRQIKLLNIEKLVQALMGNWSEKFYLQSKEDTLSFGIEITHDFFETYLHTPVNPKQLFNQVLLELKQYFDIVDTLLSFADLLRAETSQRTYQRKYNGAPLNSSDNSTDDFYDHLINY